MPSDFTSSVTNHELNEMVVCISFSFFFGFFNLGNFHCCNSEFTLVIIRQHVSFLYSKITKSRYSSLCSSVSEFFCSTCNDKRSLIACYFICTFIKLVSVKAERKGKPERITFQ